MVEVFGISKNYRLGPGLGVLLALFLNFSSSIGNGRLHGDRSRIRCIWSRFLRIKRTSGADCSNFAPVNVCSFR